LLSQQIDHAKESVQLSDNVMARSATLMESANKLHQYEALYARRREESRYLFIDERFPADVCEVDPHELREVASCFRRRLQSETHGFPSVHQQRA